MRRIDIVAILLFGCGLILTKVKAYCPICYDGSQYQNTDYQFYDSYGSLGYYCDEVHLYFAPKTLGEECSAYQLDIRDACGCPIDPLNPGECTDGGSDNDDCYGDLNTCFGNKKCVKKDDVCKLEYDEECYCKADTAASNCDNDLDKCYEVGMRCIISEGQCKLKRDFDYCCEKEGACAGLKDTCDGINLCKGTGYIDYDGEHCAVEENSSTCFEESNQPSLSPQTHELKVWGQTCDSDQDCHVEYKCIESVNRCFWGEIKDGEACVSNVECERGSCIAGVCTRCSSDDECPGSSLGPGICFENSHCSSGRENEQCMEDEDCLGECEDLCIGGQSEAPTASLAPSISAQPSNIFSNPPTQSSAANNVARTTNVILIALGMLTLENTEVGKGCNN